MPEVLLLGIGSPFAADRAGWVAVEQLREHRLHEKLSDWQVEYRLTDRPGVGLLSEFTGYRLVIIIDAAIGLPVGQWRWVGREQLAGHHGVSSHGIGVAEALDLGESLGMLPARLSVLALGVGDGTGEVIVPEGIIDIVVAELSSP